MRSDPPLRFGILGAARIAPAALIRPVRQVPGVEVVAVAARDSERARRFARRHGIRRAYGDYEGLLADAEVDAVYVALPAGLHAAWTLRALAQGKHVLCEKPLAANRIEAGRMVAAAAAAGRVLMEAMHYRYHPLWARLRACASQPELGRLRRVEASLCVPLWNRRDIRYDFSLGGGATLDVGCYPLDLIRSLAGEEPCVRGATARLASPRIDRWMEADLGFASERTARMRCSIFGWPPIDTRAVLRFERGELRVWCPFAPHYYNRIILRVGGRHHSERVPGEPTFNYQLRAFVAAVRGQRTIDLANSVANLRAIDAVYEAAGLPPRGL